MKRQIEAFDIGNTSNTENFEYVLPNQCPSCSTALEPKVLIGAFLAFDNSDGGMLNILYHCPKCSECFLGRYLYSSRSYSYTKARLLNYLPYPERKIEFPENINTISPSFVKIYNQAFCAEQRGLGEICGLGYRKAVEFLVKDYAIFLHAEDAEKIKTMHLADCINLYIENRHIRDLAKASAWIGNDETHYIRRHEDYGIAHLKSFIEAASSLINSELSALKATKLLSEKK